MRPHCVLYFFACFEIMAALSTSAVCVLGGMLLMTCCAVRCGVTSALSVQSLSLSEFLFFKKIKIIQHSQTSRKKKTCEHLHSLVLEDQDSPVLDDKLDVWPRGAAGGLPDAVKLGDGYVDEGQEALDDEVNVVDEV